MQFLQYLSTIRTPVLDSLMSLFTMFGNDSIILLICLIVFWCINKNWGYYLVCVNFLGITVNQALKLVFRVPRPWVLDPSFQIVESARADAAGFSFPSGHSTASAGVYGVLHRCTKSDLLKFIFVVFILLVPFSRMYLGVHTPKDVFVGSATGLLLVWIFQPLRKGRGILPSFLLMLAAGLVFFFFVTTYPFPSDIDAENLEHGMKNASDLLGAGTGFVVVYLLDRYRFHFNVKTKWYFQVCKVVLGLGLTLGVKEGLKIPLNSIISVSWLSESIRYFLVVVTAGFLCPLLFTKLFSRGK